MAKMKINIVGLKTLGGDNYTVGVPLGEDQNLIVEAIQYNRPDAPYNKGFQLSGPSYTVKFRDNDNLRIVIPQNAVANIGVLRTEAENNDPEAVGLVE